MSRHGYSDNLGTWDLIKWRGQVASALRGERGQKFLRALVAELDAMPEKRLIEGALEDGEGSVCALGCLGKSRGVDIRRVDTEDWDKLGELFNIAPQLAQEVMYVNDDDSRSLTPEQRWKLVRSWAAKQIRVRPEEVI